MAINRHYEAPSLSTSLLSPESSSDEVEVCVFVHSIVLFVLVKQLAELVHVPLVQDIDVLHCRLLFLLHPDWLPHCQEGQRAGYHSKCQCTL